MTLFLILRSFIGVGCGVILLFIGLFPQRIIGWSDWHTMSHYETNFNIIFLIGSSLNVVYCAGKFIINRKAGSPSFFRHNNALSDQMPLLLFRIISCIRRELTSLTFAQEYVKGRSICHYFFLIISDGLNKIVIVNIISFSWFSEGCFHAPASGQCTSAIVASTLQVILLCSYLLWWVTEGYRLFPWQPFDFERFPSFLYLSLTTVLALSDSCNRD